MASGGRCFEKLIFPAPSSISADDFTTRQVFGPSGLMNWTHSLASGRRSHIRMNIKSITGAPAPAEIKKIERRIADSSADRDPGGQGDQAPEKHPKMTPEQIAQAMDVLKGLSGVKDHNLTVRLETKDGINVVFIEDAFGKVVRRIPESELWTLLQQRDRKTGHLFDKTG